MLEAKGYVEESGSRHKVMGGFLKSWCWICFDGGDNPWWELERENFEWNSFDEAQQDLDLYAKSKGWKEITE